MLSYNLKLQQYKNSTSADLYVKDTRLVRDDQRIGKANKLGQEIKVQIYIKMCR